MTILNTLFTNFPFLSILIVIITSTLITVGGLVILLSCFTRLTVSEEKIIHPLQIIMLVVIVAEILSLFMILLGMPVR